MNRENAIESTLQVSFSAGYSPLSTPSIDATFSIKAT